MRESPKTNRDRTFATATFVFAALVSPSLASAAQIPDEQIVSVFGWDGDKDAALAYPGGYFARDGRDLRIGFKIFDGAKTYRWTNAEGYLPCLVTEFDRGSLHVRLQNFADRVSFADQAYVVAYSRVSIENRGTVAQAVSPGASSQLIRLAGGDSAMLAPGESHDFDYALAIDRFGQTYPWPSNDDVSKAGGWDSHYKSMRSYWQGRVNEIVDLQTPDSRLNDAYRAGFIYTHIIKDGTSLNVGENGYDMLWDHDAIGIFVTLLALGDFRAARELFPSLPSKLQFSDAAWKFAWPWALYLEKTDDLEFVRPYLPKIRAAAHSIEAEREADGLMAKSSNIDTLGYWTVDNWSALTGLAAYGYLSARFGDATEQKWAEKQYASLLTALSARLTQTITKFKLNYIPASVNEPNTANRCRAADDANWAAHFLFGRWAWDGWLLGAPQSGPGLDLIDASYRYGFERLKKAGLPEHTFGGYPGYSSGYNAGYGAAALRGSAYRSEGIHAYQLLLDSGLSGPFSWWETILAPAPSAWEGTHPSGGVGSSPHMWGQAVATKVLIESVLTEFYDGHLLVGRGLPDEWLAPNKSTRIANFPIAHGQRLGLTITAPKPNSIDLVFDGGSPAADIYVDLPIFLKRTISATSVGTIDQGQGRVVLPKDTRHVVITLK